MTNESELLRRAIIEARDLLRYRHRNSDSDIDVGSAYHILYAAAPDDKVAEVSGGTPTGSARLPELDSDDDGWKLTYDEPTGLHVGPGPCPLADAAVERAETAERERDEAQQWCVNEAEKHDMTRARAGRLEEALRPFAALDLDEFYVDYLNIREAVIAARAALAGVETGEPS